MRHEAPPSIMYLCRGAAVKLCCYWWYSFASTEGLLMHPLHNTSGKESGTPYW